MNYGRATLNSNWDQARESEPKDYDINTSPVRDLCKATYTRIGSVTDGSLNKTTYQAHTEQLFLKKDYEERETRKPMITQETLAHAHLDREIPGVPKHGVGAVLPCHKPDHNKYYLETTHKADFKSPRPFERKPEKMVDFPDESAAYRRCISQFSDPDGSKRPGRNTWQDESGVYANSHLKQQVKVYQFRNPIPSNLL
ncbi:LOW QUALITY PROTEIN: cilia- and flagella-associated protein 95-like [Liolophura sinensis]|uniref:LOW QUALITY PROTEIN: cilia- and flagella-associated protein 95-like n=1 Tax=Liolophura sinensis TaxID=3198878 RepID=UPI00315813B9